MLWPEPLATEAIRIFQRTLETGVPYHAPSTVERLQDIRAVESYDWKTERLTLPDGRFGVVCHFYDLSERQRYETALREADRQKDEFIAMLAHELRNPLAPIRTAAGLLRMRDQSMRWCGNAATPSIARPPRWRACWTTWIENSAAVASPLPHVSGRKVLVVDDNVDSTDVTALVLGSIGGEVRTSDAGHSSLHEAETFRPDIVLLDLGPPDLDGYEVARRIRGLPWGGDVALVAISGWGRDEDRQRSTDAGFDHHVMKPVDPDVLLSIVRNHGGQR
jgi:CheY-like chemotaxis protein